MPNGKPNILVIWGDDIGITNLSCYSDGVMGYRTPNIDRLAKEGMKFTDSYGEQSCTAGRAAFISGQSVYRTGMSKVGAPGADVGWSADDPTIAELLKPHGYATGQFGKNHFGDLNKYLPTVHGFDEFYGNLYHLNAEEEPEQFDYPHKDQFPRLYDLAKPRGVLDCKALDHVSDEPDDPKFGPVGKQSIVNTGPLNIERMKVIDYDIADRTVDFIKRKHAEDEPFFVWCNFTHMHLYTHVEDDKRGQAGLWQSEYHDTMIEHDKNVGTVLNVLDELGIAEDTIVIYSTDNGPHRNSWPDGGTTPFRSEKDTNWEGAFRVPELIRWPGHIEAGSVSNDIIQHHDWLPTLLAAAGDTTTPEELKAGKTIGDKTYRVHIDGYNLLPYLTGEVEASPRRGFFYFSDDGDLMAMRFENWKAVFMEQRCQGTLRVWAEPFTNLRVPKLFNLRTDPFEYADITSNTYYDWFLHHDYLIFYMTAMSTAFLETFKEFPPRHAPASFTIDQAVEKLHAFLAKD
ncbi:arylsulfatase [Nocardia sp. NPDC055321]